MRSWSRTPGVGEDLRDDNSVVIEILTPHPVIKTKALAEMRGPRSSKALNGARATGTSSTAVESIRDVL